MTCVCAGSPKGMEQMEKTEEIRDGKKVYVYENGAVQDAKTGHWIQPPPSAMIRTRERAQELVKRRKEIAREKIVEGIREGLGLPATALEGEEIKILARITTEAFKGSKNIRGMDSLLRTLLALGGYAETEVEALPPNQPDAQVIEAITGLLEAVNKVKERDEVINISSTK